MSRPANEAFELPPALATRSSTSDAYVAPDFRTSNLVRRTRSVTEYSDVFEPGVAITTSETTMASATATTATTATTTAAVQSGAGPSSAATAAATATAPTTTVFAVTYDTSLAPPPFKGVCTEDADEWLSRFEKYALYRALPDGDKATFLGVLLRDDAADWHDTLEPAVRTDWQALKQAFTQRFRPSDLLRWKKASDHWNRCQAAGETVDVYITAVKKMAVSVGVTGDMLRYAIQRGLRPQLLKHAIQQQPTTVDELVQAAVLWRCHLGRSQQACCACLCIAQIAECMLLAKWPTCCSRLPEDDECLALKHSTKSASLSL